VQRNGNLRFWFCPVMYLTFLCYREIVANATREQLQFAMEVHPAVVMAGSAERS
jgi:hypothetical protein